MMRIAPRLALTAILLLGALALTSPSSFGALEKGDWLIRVRGISLNPNDSSGGLKPDLTTGKVGVSADLTPEVDITYMLTNNLGLELIRRSARTNDRGPRRLVRHRFSGRGRPRHHPSLVPQPRPQIYRHQYDGHFEIGRDETEGRRRNRPMGHWNRNRVQILSRGGSPRFPSLALNRPEAFTLDFLFADPHRAGVPPRVPPTAVRSVYAPAREAPRIIGFRPGISRRNPLL